MQNDIIFWPWKGVKKDRQLVMHHDGVHLSERNVQIFSGMKVSLFLYLMCHHVALWSSRQRAAFLDITGHMTGV